MSWAVGQGATVNGGTSVFQAVRRGIGTSELNLQLVGDTVLLCLEFS